MAWLSNFHATELPAATALLDSLQFVSLQELWIGLRQLMEDLNQDLTGGSFVVIPERSLKDFGIPKEQRETAVAWDDFHPGDDLPPAGSDAFIELLTAELRNRETEFPSLLPRGSRISDLRAKRCRAIVIATDIVGSGDRVLQLAAAMVRNRSIRSWRSFGWVQIHVLAFTALPDGRHRLEQSRDIDGVHIAEVSPTLETAPVDEELRQAMVELCQRHGHESPKLGYKGSGALVVTARRAPNNVPAVFTQTTPAGWKPLFPGREVRSEFDAQLGSYRLSEDLADAAKRVRQIRLGRNAQCSSLRAPSRRLVQLLALASSQPIREADLAISLGTGIATAAEYVEAARTLGLLDATGRLTDAGKRELFESKRGRRRTTADLEGSDSPYYHHGVR